MYPFLGTFPAERIKGNIDLGPGGSMVAPAGFTGLFNTIGHVFFVDPINGNDAWDGTLPTRLGATTRGPVATTAAAYALAVANRNDVIVRFPGLETPTATLVLNKQGLSIIKSPNSFNPWQPEDAGYYWAAATGPIFQVMAPTALIGLTISAVWADGGTAAAHGCSVELNGNAGGYAGNYGMIAGCCFPGWGEAGGICLRAGSFWHIFRNSFPLGPVPETFGITLRGDVNNVTDDIIEENLFKGPATGIQAAALGNHQNMQFIRNIFAMPTVNAITGIVNFLVAAPSTFSGNICAMLAANAFDGNRAAAEAAGLFAAGNFYRDQADPRA